MDNITMALAKRDFDMGLLTGFTLERVLGETVVLIKHKYSVGRLLPLVDARTHKNRMFKTVDAAISAVESIGFSVLVLDHVS